MLTPLEEAYARLTMQQFILKMVVSDHLSSCTPQSSQTFKDNMIKALGRNYAAGNLTPQGDQKAAEIRDRSVELSEEFLEGVTTIENEIRDHRDRKHSGPAQPRSGG
jgi:hypothetical protein